MLATNHYLAGVACAAALKEPVSALPAAFASHFVLDILPHFGLKFSKRRGKVLAVVALLDVAMLLAACYITARLYPGWYILAGLLAVTPDLAWVYRFTVREKFGKLPPPPSNAFNRWHTGIQKFESTWGAAIEVPLLLALAKTVL